MTRPPAPDQAARDRIEHDLASTLFVEAGAGSGKTTALVGRVIALVTSGAVELREIAAITFTEKAAAELRDRIRQSLEQRAEAAAASDDHGLADRCHRAIDQLDGSAIGTLHAFAQRILGENPIEAGLPPRVEVVDEVASDVEFEQRWTTFQDQLLADPDVERTVLLLLAAGARIEALRALAVEFDRNWDLVEERVPADAPPPSPVAQHLVDALAVVESALAYADHCTNADDKLLAKLPDVEAWLTRARATTDEVDLLGELARVPSLRFGNVGSKTNWGCDIAEVRTAFAAAGEAIGLVAGLVTDECAQHLGSRIRSFTLAAADLRQAEGRLAFHDLLVRARALLRDPQHGAAVRRRLHDRYRRLLLDEFQDTDPIQIELAVRIAAADPESDAAGRDPWDEVPVAEGHLFVVGDPKQSIYRFRRADISLFLEAQQRFGGPGLVTLSANFRTVDPVIGWVNHVFAGLMGEAPEVALPLRSQADYVDLVPTRPAPPVGPAVSVIGRQLAPADANAAVLRAAEADDVARVVARVLDEGWEVGTGDPADPWRPARLGDITILVPARTSLPFLEDALDTGGIPYRAEASSLVYASRTVRDLLLALRAVDDPTDHLAIVATLRSPLFACGDDDLFRFKVLQRGHWSYLGRQPDTVEPGAVADGLAYLRALHTERHWLTPAQLLDRIATDRRLFELGFGEGRTRDVWRRLRFVIDQARSWSDATAGGLRAYLQWVARQSAEGSRVAEAVLPETDDDAVRIMTIHAAKGLEFPITIVSGMSTKPSAQRGPAQVVFPPHQPGVVGYRFGAAVSTEEFEEFKPLDEQMGVHERVRLLYVACTRARDHLVVSLHRKERKSASSPNNRTNAELLVDGMGDLLDTEPDAVAPDASPPQVPPSARPEPPPPFEAWEAERAAALRGGARATTVAATALTDEGDPDLEPEAEAVERDPELSLEPVERDAPTDGMQLTLDLEPVAADEPADDAAAGLQKRPRDLDLPPWLKGRYGTAVGRAVHGALQTVPLATGDGLAEAVAAQCEAEAIPDRADTVAALAQAALGSAVVQAAAATDHWREVYACTPLRGGRLLEGYLDLLYRTPDGMVVVDYKTAATNDPSRLAERVAGYRLQGASYAIAVEQTTGLAVTRVVFLFLTPSGAVELDLPDLRATMDEVARLVETGDEHEVAEPVVG